MRKFLSIVIVNWNSGNQLKDCLSSIKAQDYQQLNVIVVDNASSDKSLIEIETLGIPVSVIRNPSNLGFASACNQGARITSSPYLLFLNPDTRLFADSISRPLEFMEDDANQKVGICGIQLIDNQGEVARSCARFPSSVNFCIQAIGLNKLPWFQRFSLHMVDWDHARSKKVDHVIGAYFLVRRSLYDQLKGFDQRFFVYLEDLDFSRRANMLGYDSIYLADIQAFHAGGGTSKQVKAKRLFYALRSRLLYAFKHFSVPAASMVLLLTLFVEPFSRIVFSLFFGERKDFIHTLQGYGLLIKNLPELMRVVFKSSHSVA